MFQPGDLIIYGSSGVCRVAAVGAPGVASADKNKLYYKLLPVYSTETIYTPVDTGAFMRPIISREEAQAVIAQIPFIEEDVCRNRSLSQLRDHYESAFVTHNCEDLIQLLKSVYTKSKHATQNGKKLGQVDQKYQKRAQDILYGELSVALGIPRGEMVGYIESVVTAMVPPAEEG